MPRHAKPDDLKTYFAALVESHSWSTVKIDRNGLQFFWKHVLGKPWQFVDIIKPPTVKSLLVILTTTEIELLLNKARKLHYYTILLTLYRELLGHMWPKTTAIYTRLTETTQLNTRRIINHLIDELGLKGDDQ
ncbi:phage integrase N-terminal SAM-like domain-containing protein [Endozoicomonas sp. SESOKO1]|uniref:phage integrase N-terminal SAM-like domain-containing protein n=1 Tax=Endozoicomonas sp. SESOKO1 TaxID=2828742 RepID=UPI002148A85A|nr:phage integrase N-terminal SAM-like domain-containing protein [Endozoicomonas sp. SESOKO1]